MSKFEHVNDPLEVIQQALYAAEWHPQQWCELQLLPLDWPTKPVIDNVAVLYTDAEAEAAFVQAAMDDGWELFNTSHDRVYGHLNTEQYDVRFQFLRDPDNADFRIESMLVGPDWLSPIHHGLLVAYGQGCVAQGSYKPRDKDGNIVTTLEAYQAENRYLKSSGYDIIEAYVAEYGWYTYWQLPNTEDMAQGYLKVRLNTRDDAPYDAAPQRLTETTPS